MSGWRKWLATMPLPAHFVFTAVVFGSVTYAVRQAVEPSHAEPWWVVVTGAILFGAGTTWVVARRRRRFGGADRMLTVARALKQGRLPEDADPDTWNAALDRQERTMRRLRRWAPIEFAAFAVLEGALALTHESVWWWVFCAFFAVLFAVSLITPPRTLRKIERLRAQLRERPAPFC